MKLNATNTAIIKRLLIGRNSRPLLSILSRVEPADLASLITHLNSRETQLMLDALMVIHRISDVLIELPTQHLERLLSEIEDSMLLNLLIYAPEEHAAYLLSVLAAEKQEEILLQLEVPKRQRIRLFLAYPKDSAGRIMQPQVFTIPTSLTAAQAIDYIRGKSQELSIYYLYCVNESNQLIGVVSLRVLATSKAEIPVSELIRRDVVTVKPDTPSKEVARLVAHYDFVAIPVVDESNRLMGVVTVDDILDIVQEEATANIYTQALLQKDDRVYTPAWQSLRNRIPWMVLNLGLAAVASSIVSLFEETMSHLIILASLKNIVAGIGGNTAIQTLTVVTRGLATGDFTFISKAKGILKETIVGSTLGLITGILCALLVYMWKGSLLVSIVICISMILNSFIAALFGALIPLALQRFRWDPAIGSGVIATMITDIFGFVSFLGIASLGLRLVGQ